jgi:hypothetical protein
MSWEYFQTNWYLSSFSRSARQEILFFAVVVGSSLLKPSGKKYRGVL